MSTYRFSITIEAIEKKQGSKATICLRVTQISPDADDLFDCILQDEDNLKWEIYEPQALNRLIVRALSDATPSNRIVTTYGRDAIWDGTIPQFDFIEKILVLSVRDIFLLGLSDQSNEERELLLQDFEIDSTTAEYIVYASTWAKLSEYDRAMQISERSLTEDDVDILNGYAMATEKNFEFWRRTTKLEIHIVDRDYIEHLESADHFWTVAYSNL